MDLKTGAPELFNWYTLVGGIIIGVLINILSHYLIPSFDNFVGSISFRWRTRTDRKKKQYEQLLARCERDPLLVLLLGIDQTRTLGLVIMLFLMATIMISLMAWMGGRIPVGPVIFMKLMVLGLLTCGCALFLTWIRKHEILRDLKERRLLGACRKNAGEWS
jgi:hypothetical protein